MRKDLINIGNKIYSSFMSHDRDIEKVLKALFVQSRPYSDYLKRLLIINAPDCLDMNNTQYQKVIDSFTLKDLIDKEYIRLNPRIQRGEHQEIKTYILINLDHYTQGQNPNYRDYTLDFDIVSVKERNVWVLNNYKIRPITIAGCIDGILNSVLNKNGVNNGLSPTMKLTGIGRYEFLKCDLTVLNEDLSMYTLSYLGKHFSEDKKEITELEEK